MSCHTMTVPRGQSLGWEELTQGWRKLGDLWGNETGATSGRQCEVPAICPGQMPPGHNFHLKQVDAGESKGASTPLPLWTWSFLVFKVLLRNLPL